MFVRLHPHVASAAAACAVVLAGLAGIESYASGQPRLSVGGSRAAAGVHALGAGFSPDPFVLACHPLGALQAGEMRLGAGCRGYVSAEPTAIVRFAGAAPFLRFFVRSARDTTLLIHDPSGRFYCNDDVVPGRDHAPMVDVYRPRPGQYDVWIGAHEPDVRGEATLLVTADRGQRP